MLNKLLQFELTKFRITCIPPPFFYLWEFSFSSSNVVNIVIFTIFIKAYANVFPPLKILKLINGKIYIVVAKEIKVNSVIFSLKRKYVLSQQHPKPGRVPFSIYLGIKVWHRLKRFSEL